MSLFISFYVTAFILSGCSYYFISMKNPKNAQLIVFSTKSKENELKYV